MFLPSFHPFRGLCLRRLATTISTAAMVWTAAALPGSARAARLYQLGCEGGQAHECSNLGVLHYNGNGMAQHSVTVLSYFETSCQMGRQTGCDHAVYVRARLQ